MGRYQGLSTAFVDRLDAATDKLRGDDDYVPVDMSFMDDLTAMLDADRDGRPYSHRPRTTYDDARDAQRLAAGGGPCDLSNPDDPGALFLRMTEQLRQRMEASGDAAELRSQLEQAKRDTLGEIEAESRSRERKERQRLKRQRRKGRKAEAARGAAV